MSNRIPNWIKVLMLKGEKGDKGDGLSVSETPIDNGHQVTITDADGSVSFDLHNATSGDYSGLTNKPSINNSIINGNKTFADFGIVYDEILLPLALDTNGNQAMTGDTITIPSGDTVGVCFGGRTTPSLKGSAIGLSGMVLNASYYPPELNLEVVYCQVPYNGRVVRVYFKNVGNSDVVLNGSDNGAMTSAGVYMLKIPSAGEV